MERAKCFGLGVLSAVLTLNRRGKEKEQVGQLF